MKNEDNPHSMGPLANLVGGFLIALFVVLIPFIILL